MIHLKKRVFFTVLHDFFILCGAFFFALWLRLEAQSFELLTVLIPYLVLFNLSTLVFQFRFGLYKGIWRYASIKEILAIFKSITASCLIVVAALFLTIRLENIPRSFPILLFIVSLLGISGPRIFYRLIKDNLNQKNSENKINVIIAGDGDASELFIRAAKREKDSPYNIVGIIGLKKKSTGSLIHGVPVITDIENFLKNESLLENKYSSVQRVIITDHGFSNSIIEKLFIFTKKNGLAIGEIPRITEIKKTKLDSFKTNPIEVEDILGRRQKIHKSENYKFIKDKVILVTGAGGSIGFELCKQLLNFSPRKLILFEQNEFHLYKAFEKLDKHLIVPILGDVRDRKKLSKVFRRFNPNIVFHSAALKHITFVEDDPLEAIKTNFVGTFNIIHTCEEFNVTTMVFISTDKAVNPTTFMGATKRLCEKYIQNLDSRTITKLKIVRFGNVLGSAGSVIPLFEEQITRGGPITITDPNVQRYFMTIREAVELVIIASLDDLNHKNGEINILEMGEPVKIKDLARKMIKLSGQKKDIRLKYTSLRKGEKLTEQLFYKDEEVSKTQNSSILKTTVKVNRLKNADIDIFLDNLENKNEQKILEKFYKLLPEYVRYNPK